jgi:cytochrome P450 family 135
MRSRTPHIPPGPLLPAVAQTALLAARPFEFVGACRDRYGDIFRLRVSGVGGIVCVFDPAAIQEVFSHDGVVAHAGEANTIIAPVVGSQSILTIDRDEHLGRRREISPAFHGAALKSAQADIEAILAVEESRWPRERPFALRPALQRITFRFIALLALGPQPETRVDRLLALFERLVSFNPAGLHPALRLDLGPLTPWGRFRRVQRLLDEELLEIISTRMRKPEPEGEDLLGVIVRGCEGNVQRARDELMALLLAGHETTATALSWAFERLARNPRVLAVARSAAATSDFDYLDAVALETLRARPVLSDVGRVIDQPLVLGGYTLPAGTTLRLSIALVQSDPGHYPQPDEFRPERFIGIRPDPTIWLPFGGGRRRCIGAGLAQVEMRTILRHVLARRSVQAPDPRPERPVPRGVTYAPGRDAFLELPVVRADR